MEDEISDLKKRRKMAMDAKDAMVKDSCKMYDKAEAKFCKCTPQVSGGKGGICLQFARSNSGKGRANEKPYLNKTLRCCIMCK